MEEWRPVAPDDLPVAARSRSADRGAIDVLRHLRDLVAWYGVGRIVLMVLAVPVVGIGVYFVLRTPPPPVENQLEFATTPQSTITAPTSVPSSTVTVHVAGHVGSPGVYVLELGGRVVDAIRAAGGASAIADLDRINLAVILEDGDQVYVPAIGEIVDGGVVGRITSSRDEAHASFPVNINTASAGELEALPGIGPSTAAAIVQYRNSHGSFTSTSALLDVPGIGAAKFEALKDLITT